MNNAIVVNETGWKAMGFSSDFKKYAREKGIRDPFEVSQKLFAKRVKRNEDGSTTVRIEQDENGRMHNEILGRWEMTFQITDGQTSEDTLKSIMSVMEKFVRTRFSVKEPTGLDAIALEYKRGALLKDHFIL